MDLIRSANPPGGAELALVAAVIREESAYDPRAVSSVGAIGLMQLMPDTGRWVARRIGLDLPGKDALYNPETNIRLGASYLSFLLEQFEGNFVYAIAAYNAGSGAVDRWITSFGSRDQDEFIESIPYRETRNFVKRVLRSLGEYRRISSLMNNALIS
jgi:soluble lytic murein transglycosylase